MNLMQNIHRCCGVKLNALSYDCCQIFLQQKKSSEDNPEINMVVEKWDYSGFFLQFISGLA